MMAFIGGTVTGSIALCKRGLVRHGRVSRPSFVCLIAQNNQPTLVEDTNFIRNVTASKAATATMAVVGAALVSMMACGVHDAGAHGLENGRLAKCRGDAPCISTTSVGNPSKFGPPWSYQPETDDPAVAWDSLKRAITSNADGGAIVESVDGPKEYYLRAEFPSTWRGIDDVEFRLLQSDSLVTYRSASREAIFIYPLQTPINFNKNKKRLEDIRSALGWEEFSGNELYTNTK